MPRTPFLAVFALGGFAVALAACAGTPAQGNAGGGLVPPPSSAIPQTASTCDHDKAQWAVGKPADEALLKQVAADARVKFARTLKPGQMVTLEYNGDRVNVELDENGVVKSVRCG